MVFWTLIKLLSRVWYILRVALVTSISVYIELYGRVIAHYLLLLSYEWMLSEVLMTRRSAVAMMYNLYYTGWSVWPDTCNTDCINPRATLVGWEIECLMALCACSHHHHHQLDWLLVIKLRTWHMESCVPITAKTMGSWISDWLAYVWWFVWLMALSCWLPHSLWHTG